MGFNQCSLAIRGKSPESILTELHLRPTGEMQEFPEAEYAATLLPSGWYVIVAENSENRLIDEETLAAISIGGEAIACSVEEHVMVSTAHGWRDGKRIWSVTHNAQESIENLETDGELPPAFASLRDDHLAKQAAAGGRKANVDYVFDVPVEVARSFTDYRYDKDAPGLIGDAFEVLESHRPPSTRKTPAPTKSFFQRLFGK